MPQCAKKYCFWRLYCAAGLQKCNFYNESGFLRFFIKEYSIVLNLVRKVQTLLHKMSFAGSTEDGLYWHVLCLNLENLSRGSRLTFCARFVALYFKKILFLVQVSKYRTIQKVYQKHLRSQTISKARVHTASGLPHNL